MPVRSVGFTLRLLSLAGLILSTAPVQAHSFGKIYTLPIPVWMYLYGAAAALVVSFLVIGYFVGNPKAAERNFASRDLPRGFGLLAAPATVWSVRILSTAILLLTLVTALMGVRNPYANFSMTLFWIVLLLGYAYWVALFGNSYSATNPWRAPMRAISLLPKVNFEGRRTYPAALAYWPAVAMYLGIIWLELLGESTPKRLGGLLLIYAVVTFAGCWIWGQRAWFRHADFFAVFFRVLGLIAPIYREQGRFRLRHPFMGLLTARCEHPSLLIFILFMLSSTAYDGLHETIPWVRLFWHELLPPLKPWLGEDLVRDYQTYKAAYAVYQNLGLVISPLVYLALYALAVWAMKRITATRLGVGELCMIFALTLVPIAFVYHLTHYFTLLMGQGPLLIKLISDPFGYGWNLFQTARWFGKSIIPDVGVVWHLQVALILWGHIVSVYLAHVVALRIFPTARTAVLSQLPMLVLMVFYTAAGLWILGQPLQAGVIMPATQ